MVADRVKMTCQPPKSAVECQEKAFVRILVGEEPNFCTIETDMEKTYFKVADGEYADACENGYTIEETTGLRRCASLCGALVRARIPDFPACETQCMGQFG